MAAALLSFTTLYISLGVIAGLALLRTVVFWAVRHCHDGGGGGGVSSSAGKHEELLNKKKGAAPQPPEPGDGDVDLCAICKARLADAEGWGRCRRLRPCGHVYHAECVGLWLQCQCICHVCRAAVAMSWHEILGAMVRDPVRSCGGEIG